jgi:hypothetical protein
VKKYFESERNEILKNPLHVDIEVDTFW